MLAALLLALLPAHLDPPAPFPRVVFDAPTIERVAPGVTYGEYDLVTAAGPIVVHAIEVEPHAPNIALNAVLAGDTLISSGETVSSMAHRTGAIAGINADYFDIGNTNQPTNIVAHDGALVRTPSKRFALVIGTDGSPQIVQTSFTGSLQLSGRTVTLDALNQMPPPDGGVSLLTPSFGPVPPAANVTLVAMDPTSGVTPFATYRVTSIADNSVKQPPGFYVAIGLNAYGTAGVPNAGDTIVASGDLSPVSIANLTAAVGGGPLILDDGAWVDDPAGPNGGEYAQRIPCSGAAIAGDGTLYLIEVDGREPDLSAGVTRQEFSALMRAFGAVRGLAFDGGGSSEIVAREPGDASAQLANVPSDGHERKVADGIFVYDTAPPGPPAQIVALPVAVRAMRGASVSVRFVTADANENAVAAAAPIDVRVEPAQLGTYRDGIFTAAQAGEGTLVARSGTLISRLPVRVYQDPARVALLPQDASAAQGGRVTLQARAYDAQGYAIALPPVLPWRAEGGSIDGTGTLTAGKSDAIVSLLLGDHLASTRVTVGFHDVPITGTPSFMTAPRGGDGSAGVSPACAGCLNLQYALGPAERAAYMVTGVTLPPHTVSIAFDVLDDGQGALLKLALRNAINEEVLLSAGPLDRPGWRHVEVRLPQGIAQPARLVALYVIGANATTTIAGTITVKNLHAIVAGAGAESNVTPR